MPHCIRNDRLDELISAYSVYAKLIPTELGQDDYRDIESSFIDVEAALRELKRTRATLSKLYVQIQNAKNEIKENKQNG